MSQSKLILEKETFELRGACFEVYREKGCGFVEAVYQECLELELTLRGIAFVPQPRLQLEYKGQQLRAEFQPDLICFQQLVVELKAVRELTDEHRAPGAGSQLFESDRASGWFARKLWPLPRRRNRTYHPIE